MRKIFYFFVLLLLLGPFPIVAQSSAEKVLKEEQGKFFHQLKYISLDSAIVHQLSRSVKIELDSIFSVIKSNTALPAAEKKRRSLALLIL